MICDRKQGSTLFLRSVAKTSTALVHHDFGQKTIFFPCIFSMAATLVR